MAENALFAILLTLFAGLATGIGSCIAFFAKSTNKKFLSLSLGFSAGVMIYIAFTELLSSARVNIAEELNDSYMGDIISTSAFFGGIFIAACIDKLVPSFENPHEIRGVEQMNKTPDEYSPEMRKKLSRMGLVTAIAIGIHNFPEGIATFMSAIESPELGVAIAIAIAIHNIPEGIAVSVPIYAATGSKKKAFIYSFLSGVAEPIGALVAYAILLPYINPVLLSCTFAAVAGIMVFISIDELLPAAREYGEHHLSIYGLILGMIVMAISLIILL